jgi:hypothetical protein
VKRSSDEFEQKCAALSQELTTAQNELAAAQRASATALAQLKEQTEQLAASGQEVQHLQTEVKAKTEECESLRKQLSSASTSAPAPVDEAAPRPAPAATATAPPAADADPWAVALEPTAAPASAQSATDSAPTDMVCSRSVQSM